MNVRLKNGTLITFGTIIAYEYDFVVSVSNVCRKIKILFQFKIQMVIHQKY